MTKPYLKKFVKPFAPYTTPSVAQIQLALKTPVF